MRSYNGGHSGAGRSNGGTANGTLVMGPGLGFRPSTPRPSHESDRSNTRNGDHSHPPGSPISSPEYGERRDTEAILQSLPRQRGDMPPPPYIGQPLSEGTNTQTLSSSGEGTATSQESPGSNQALLASLSGSGSALGSGSGSGHYGSSTRPLPLAPPEVERVVERKMDEMASSTYTGGPIDAFTATRLGLGPAAQPEGKGSPSNFRPQSAMGTGTGTGTARMEDIVDQKLDTYNAQSAIPRQATAGPSGGRHETMEQLVDRKIGLSDHTSSSATHSHSSTYLLPPPPADHTSRRFSSEITASPIHIHPPDNSSTWPGSNPPPHFSPTSPITSAFRGKGKAAEAGFELALPIASREMTLEEMIEKKMEAMRASKLASQATEVSERPHPTSSRSGESETRRRSSKGKRKGRARAGSDPGPKLQKHEETDEDESAEG